MPLPHPTYLPKKAFTGSCHCGAIRYAIKLGLPADPIDAANPPRGILPSADTPMTDLFQDIPRIYKCNCTTCHKMGAFHLRLADPRNDFVILSPSTKEGLEGKGDGDGLGRYRCNKKRSDFWFCRTCGVRCFTIAGDTGLEDVRIDLEKWKAGGSAEDVSVAAPEGGRDAGDASGQSAVVDVVRPREGWVDMPGFDYLSVNAVTLDAEQEGLDLREWTEKGWVAYGNVLKGPFQIHFGKPFEGGMY